MQDGRGFARFAAEEGIAGTQRQTVGVAHDGADHQPHVEVEVFHQTADDLDLLKILLPKVGEVGLHQIEQFQHNGGDAAEMAGPRGAFEGRGELARLDKGVESRRVDVLLTRSKNPIDVESAEGLGVFLEVARIAGKILARIELCGINKDGNQHGVTLLLGPANKTLVAFVQGSHRRHQGQRPAARAQFAHVALQFRNRGYQPRVHRRDSGEWTVVSCLSGLAAIHGHHALSTAFQAERVVSFSNCARTAAVQ